MTTRSSPGSKRQRSWIAAEQPLVVEVAVAEVVAEHDPGDQLALAHVVVLDVVDGARHEAVEGAPVRVHRAEGEAFVDEHLDQLGVVELGQLLGDDRRRLDQLAVELRLGAALLAEQPLAGRPVAGVVAHRGQEGDQVGAEVAEHRDADAGDGEDREQQRVVEGRERHVAVVPEEEEDAEDHEDVPLQRHRQREGREDVEVEDRPSRRRRSCRSCRPGRRAGSAAG